MNLFQKIIHKIKWLFMSEEQRTQYSFHVFGQVWKMKGKTVDLISIFNLHEVKR